MIERTLDISTRDGAMETFLCHPERGHPHPVVILLVDAPGIREELRDMARRVATVGYYVVLPNLYYRAGRDPLFDPDVLEPGSAEQVRMRAIRTKMTIPPVMGDVADILSFADGQEAARPGPVRSARLLHEWAPTRWPRRRGFRNGSRRRLLSTERGWSATPSRAST